MTLFVSTDRPLIPAERSCHRHAVLRIVAPPWWRSGQRPSVAVSFVLDRSGSMGGGKLELARTAVLEALRRLEARDSFSAVVFDNEVDVVIAQGDASAEALSGARARLSRVQARGSTDLGGGWLTGCGQVAERLAPERVGRALLLTDGLANVGITDRAELCRHARALRERGVSTSCFGVGADFDEGLLGAMADAGGGAFHFIDDPVRIPALIDAELGEAMDVVAREVLLDVELGPGAAAAELIGPWTATARAGGLRVSLPDLVSNQELELVIRLELPAGTAGEQVAVPFRLQDREGALGGAEATLTFTRAPSAACESQPRDRDADRSAARAHADRAREDAAQLNRDGRFDASRRRLERVAARIRRYAGQDPELGGLVAELEQQAPALGEACSALDLKELHYASTLSSRGLERSGMRRKKK